MNPQVIEFDNQEYDINNIFNFNFNFDQLKFILMSLMKKSEKSTQKIEELEELMTEKEERISDLEKQIGNQDVFLSSKYDGFAPAAKSGKKGEDKVDLVNFFIFLKNIKKNQEGTPILSQKMSRRNSAFQGGAGAGEPVDSDALKKIQVINNNIFIHNLCLFSLK